MLLTLYSQDVVRVVWTIRGVKSFERWKSQGNWETANGVPADECYSPQRALREIGSWYGVLGIIFWYMTLSGFQYRTTHVYTPECMQQYVPIDRNGSDTSYILGARFWITVPRQHYSRKGARIFQDDFPKESMIRSKVGWTSL